MKPFFVAGLLTLAAAGPLLSQEPLAPSPDNRDFLTRSTSDKLSQKRYVVAGDRAYEIGTLDGAFPSMGWHIKGHMGGVWAHPIKLLDTYQLSVAGVPLPPANRFTSAPGFVRFDYPGVNGIEVTRTTFSPDGLPAVLVGLTLRNGSGATRTFDFSILATSELVSAYPWSGTVPTFDDLHQPDQVTFDPTVSGLVFTQPGKPWTALVTGSPLVTAGTNSARFSGANVALAAPQPKQASGKLTWQVTITAGSELSLWLVIAGSNVGRGEVYHTACEALSGPECKLEAKVHERLALLGRSRVDIPRKDLQAAFDWAKFNLADMRREVEQPQIRDTQEGTVYPPPIATYARLRGFGAGYPDYPWYFGTDGCYTVFPLVAVGQFQQAKEHLNLLRRVSETVNGSTGKVLHEIVTTGDIYFGTAQQPGDSNETAEFATAVATLWRWSGDPDVLNANYAFIVRGLHYLTSALDLNQDGWPEGAGMEESAGQGAEKVDVAVYTVRALNDLVEMASARNDEATRSWASAKVQSLLNRFDTDWWMPAESLYADSLALNHAVPTDPPAYVAAGATSLTKLQQLFWTNATPMETSLASASHAQAAFARLESSTFTGATGFYQAGAGGGSTGTGDLEASALNTSVMAVAESNYGRVDEALRYALFIADQLDAEQPGALPELFDSPGYDHLEAFTKRAMVMQAWSSYGVVYPVVSYFLGIRPDAPQHRVSVVPQLPAGLPSLNIDGVRVGDQVLCASAHRDGNVYTTRVSVPPGFQAEIGYALPAGATVKQVHLNGTPAAYVVHTTLRGSEVVVQGFGAGDYELQVEAR